MVEKKASDLHLKVGSPPTLRIEEKLVPFNLPPLTPADTERMAFSLLSEKQKESFLNKWEIDLAHSLSGVGRFRVNISRQRNTIALAIRWVKTNILSFEELHLPPIFKELSLSPRGFILITGTSSSGKSTTQAAMLDYINRHRRCHIITIEDPIEFLHEDKLSLISQREVGIDTESFSTAIRQVVRQDPDVVLIGEMRDAETFSVAIAASETGHLVISTLHTADVMQSMDRLLDFFPSSQHGQIRALLSLNLRAITCQRLLSRADGKGRVPAVEVMLASPAIVKLIRENRMHKIPIAIQSGMTEGMQTFNQALVKLVQEGMITKEEALASSSVPEALRMNLQGIYLS
ncbi:PilT/PilU family type 4a pilus ATPase, partial [candidate division NPL-UPA2 bacterium]|nr:PilT/PilU family type 4a pilus ATPase [candidate division NPL-UPA2 bacterium]